MAPFLLVPLLPVMPGDALAFFVSGFGSGWIRPSEEGADEAQGGTLRPLGEDLRAQMRHRLHRPGIVADSTTESAAERTLLLKDETTVRLFMHVWRVAMLAPGSSC